MPAPEILKSIVGKALGLDKDGYLVTPKGNAVPVGPASSGFPPYGVTYMTSSVQGFELDNPIPGVRKTLAALIGTTATGRYVQCTTVTDVTFDGVNNKWATTGTQTLELIGITSARWQVLSNSMSGTTTSVGTLSTI